MIDWKFWVLNQIAQNLLAYESKDNKLFFPEDINFLVASWLKQIKNFFYLDNVSFTFTPCTDIEEVYIHKVSIRRAFINLLTLAINTCWSKPDSVISVNIQSFYSKQDFYVIEIKHNGPADKELIKQIIESTDRTAPTTDLPVLLSSTIRILDNHKAQLSTAYPKGGETVFRMLMPQYPIKT